VASGFGTAPFGISSFGAGGGGLVTPPQPAWMVIGADTPSELATAKANGATHGLVEVYWDQVQGTSGGAVNAAGVLTSIQNVLDAGLKVCLRANLQYIPTFVDTAATKFRRNGAVDHNPGNVSGDNARDWVWSAATRALVDDYLTKLFAQLDWSKIDRVQLGGGPAGELQYPDSDGTQWWGYSAPAQTGTGLAADQVVCPVPGHVPSTGTTWTANDIAFVNWYGQSLINWMLWLVAKHRAYFSGPIWVMHPGAGLRRTSQTPTGGQALNYRVNVAKGVDWDAQIAAYPDADVHPYCTWADAAHFAGQPFSDVNDGDAAPWYHLLRVARKYNRQARIWGENTGGQSNTDMDRVFASGAVAYGYQGLTWLSHDSLADGTSDTYANWATRITVANRAYAAYARGLNMAGGEFAPSAATLPGVYGTDYAYDVAAAFTAVAGRGHKIVRVPFRWERLQPTRAAALNATELTRLQGVVSTIQSAGMKAVLDCHNDGRYINSTANGGAELVLGNTLPQADLVDLWTRLSTAFRANPGIYAYGLMNEPHDLSGTAGTLSGTTRYDWNDGTVQGWTGDTATASNVGLQLRLSGTVSTSGFFLLRKDDAATLRNNTATGSVLQAVLTLGSTVTGSWSAKLQWQTQGFTWTDATSVSYTRVDTGATVSGLIAGVAVRVTATHSAITTPRAFAIQVESNNAAAGSVSVDIDTFAQGTLTGGATPAQVWENAAQACVTAIRNNADGTRIAVSGYNWSGAKTWAATHPTAWITDAANNIVYEAHYYFDDDNSGDYPNSYATENAAAVTAGYASLASRAVTELQSWTSWLTAHGVRGLLGEIGWPNTADTASWNAVGDALYREANLHAVDVTYWAGGARWGTTYNLSIYTGANQDVVKSQATTVEAHPSSTGGQSVPVTFRSATDDARGTAPFTIPALPAGVVEGDLLICVQTSDLNGNTGSMLAPDASWTQIGSFTRADVGYMKVWRKTAGPSEPATYEFQDSTAAHSSAIIIAVAGQDATAPIAVAPTFASGATATAHPAPTVAGVAGGLLVTAHLAATGGTSRTYTAPTGMTTAETSALTSGPRILTGAYYLALGATGPTGAKSATCSTSTPYVTMSLVVAPVVAAVTVNPGTAGATGAANTAAQRTSSRTTPPAAAATGAANNATPSGVSRTTAVAGLGSATGAANNPSVSTSSATTTRVIAGLAGVTGAALGSNTGAANGFQVTAVTPSGASGVFPSNVLFPSDTLFPSDGTGAGPQTVTAAGIASAEAFGSPVVTLAEGPQTVIANSIGSAEAFGVPTVTLDVAPQTVTGVGIGSAEAFGRPTVAPDVAPPPPPQSAAQYLDTYYIDGVDLSTFTTQIEVGEGLQDTPGTVGTNVALPGMDGGLQVFGALGQPRRPDGEGRLTLDMWLDGVDPDTGELLEDNAASAQVYLSRWDDLVRIFHRRQFLVDHPRPDGTRRALAHLVPGESMAPSARRASPWFGRFRASVAIPGAHWTDITEVTTGPTSLATNGVLSLAPWAQATAPCTELRITFGPGNNPRLSTAYGFVGFNGVIAAGRQLTIDTATGQLGPGSGQLWTPTYESLIYSPGPRLFEIDPSEALQAILTHTGGGSMTVEVTGKRRYRTS
jgi:hypothetical protein